MNENEECVPTPSRQSEIFRVKPDERPNAISPALKSWLDDVIIPILVKELLGD